MNRSLVASALSALAAFAAPILAQEPPKAGAPKLLTPDASLNLRGISDLQFSPDGNRLAFVVMEPAKGERRARHIWIYEKQSRFNPAVHLFREVRLPSAVVARRQATGFPF